MDSAISLTAMGAEKSWYHRIWDMIGKETLEGYVSYNRGANCNHIICPTVLPFTFEDSQCKL